MNFDFPSEYSAHLFVYKYGVLMLHTLMIMKVNQLIQDTTHQYSVIPLIHIHLDVYEMIIDYLPILRRLDSRPKMGSNAFHEQGRLLLHT